jgi:small subunit ribosomal protein S1
LEGLLHISELADHKVESPEEVVKVGDEIEVRVLRVDRAERKIGLSRKKAGWNEEEGGEEPTSEDESGTPREAKSDQSQLKGGLGGRGPLFSLGGDTPPTADEEPTPEAAE